MLVENVLVVLKDSKVGWFGALADLNRTCNYCILTDARVLEPDNSFVEVALEGPSRAYVSSVVVPKVTLFGISRMYECTEEAVLSWQKYERANRCCETCRHLLSIDTEKHKTIHYCKLKVSCYNDASPDGWFVENPTRAERKQNKERLKTWTDWTNKHITERNYCCMRYTMRESNDS